MSGHAIESHHDGSGRRPGCDGDPARRLWLPCTWLGTAGTTRKARTDTPVTFAAAMRGSNRVLVRVTDNPEVPIVSAGNVTVVQ